MSKEIKTDEQKDKEALSCYHPEAIKWFEIKNKNPIPRLNGYNYFPFFMDEAKKDFDYYNHFPFPSEGIPIWMHGTQCGLFYTFKVGNKYIYYEMDNNEVSEEIIESE